MKNLVLAIDTASEYIALAVGTLDGKLLASDDHPARREANVQLMPSIDALFVERGLSKHNIACVVCGRGPGSFTGVRIAVATAKGIAYGLGVPLYGVSTLEAIAWGAQLAGVRGTFGVIADAMRGEIYPLRFDLTDGYNTGAVVARDAHTVAKAVDVAKRWCAEEEHLMLAGDGLHKYAETFIPADDPAILNKTRESPCSRHQNSPSFTLASESLWIPTGRGLLHAFWAQRTSGTLSTTGNPEETLPIYTRLSDAEENERKRLAAAGGAITQGALIELPRSGVADSVQAARVVYRPMASGDLDLVTKLEAQVFSPNGVRSVVSGECWTHEMFADELVQKDRSWWVAYVGDTLVGFVGGWVVDGLLHVLNLAVALTYRRRGIGRELMNRLIEDAAALGATSITLEVRSSNTEAQAFYASLGLEQKGIRPRYYTPRHVGEKREDALIFSSAELPAQEATTLQMFQRSDCSDGKQDACDAIPNRSLVARGTLGPRILAIETSCDETAAAVIDGSGRILSNVIASQVDFHARFGGVVPEIASRKHTENIVGVVDTSLHEAQPALSIAGIDAVAVTYAPGLIGALVVGVAFAKGLSWAINKPFIKVNHLEGHIYSNRLDSPELEPPFIIALLSGGNTMLVHARAWGDYKVLGQTLDDAVGEAFDKVAKALGLGYPGGPAISKLAEKGCPSAICFPRALMHSNDFSFSLSGLKTAVISYIRQEQAAGRELSLPDLAASFEQAVIDVQVAKACAALEKTGATTFCLGGGVAANKALRAAYLAAMEPRGIRVVVPASIACTDNAAMIAAVALDRYNAGKFAVLTDDAHASANLEQAY